MDLKVLEKFDEALKNGYIKAYFQPLTRSVSGKVCGAEALARWEDPDEGIISPAEFIGILEENRLIHKLDLAILENVCKFYKKSKFKDLTFSVNLSRLDFKETDMFAEITEIMSEYDVPASAISLEITESTMLGDYEVTHKLFNKFHDAGYKIWLDDFGSGFSSLNILRNYEFDVLKIDMSLLRNFDTRSQKIIASIINMAKMLGTHTLSEGVETDEQRDFLRDNGCEILQGFYFSKPINEEEFTSYLEANTSETKDEHKYWSDVGKVNFLSGDPLSSTDISPSDNEKNDFGVAPLAFIEYDGKKITYPYVNKAYIEQVKKIGYSSVDAMEEIANSEDFEYYKRFMQQIEATINRGGIFRMDNIINDVVYTFTTKLVASGGNKHMIAATVHTISSEKSNYLILKHNKSLYATYDLVTEINPDKDSAIQIFSNSGFSKIYGTSSLRKGIVEFASNEIHPDDKERYLAFFDIDTLKSRISIYIQDSFRVKKYGGDGYIQKNIRISKLDNKKYLYTIQSV
ncbi:MAG: EAL domain-containing protein [Firmicutes bacterium]|nr:EAL domain-containing protein [Bacillota bacterium]